jgi:hypothetical protein
MREGGGHEVWQSADSRRRTWIGRHRGEVPAGTLHSILRDLEISREDLDNA